MAGSAVISLKAEISGLGVTTNLPIEFTHSVTPAQVLGPMYVVLEGSATAADLSLGDIAPEDVTGILIIARAHLTYIQVSKDGTGTPDADDISIEGDNNESVYLNFTGGLNASGSIRVKSDAADAALEYFVFGQHSE
jgi:hypothetical protein